jgi:hypothetical protein
VSVGACLIVRDAATLLPRSLPPLVAALDQVVVHDTGSADDSIDVARRLGAEVSSGPWPHDFGRARNAALRAMTTSWVLSVDADEIAAIDRAALDLFLSGLDAEHRAGAVVAVERADLHADGALVRFHTPRLFRRGEVHWRGRVHETLVAAHPATELSISHCPRDIVRLDHSGYADEAGALARARRNVALSRAEVDALRGEGTVPAHRLARALLDLGRSHFAAGDLPAAEQALEAARAAAGTAPRAADVRARTLDHLVQVYLRTARFGAVGPVVAQLRELSVDPGYCDWLLAQALAQSGDPAAALRLLEPLTSLVDSGGRTLDAGVLVEFRGLTRALVGDVAGALGELVTAMCRHGRITAVAPLARDLVGAADLPKLVAVVRHHGGPHAEPAARALLTA